MMIQNPLPRLLKRPCLALSLPLLLAFGGVPASHAAPGSPQVVAGQATFGQQGNVFSITNTPNTIINWQSFSVAAGDITRFIQQDANSAVLNRITGQDPSRILGALQSNGQVFLINPNGILFGRDARIDVGGLAASTLNLSNADFLAGKRNFNGTPAAGAIVNQGAITTPGGGKVFLIAPNVENSGIITSPQGEVVLAAGHSVQLVDSSNPDLHVVVSSPASAALNLGQVIAQGGKIGIYGALVRQRGLVSANSAQIGANGKIVFKASADALLEAGSVTSATGAGKGGEISVQGERVGLTGDARIDASGAAGGGSVLVGGGYQGKNALVRNAQQTVMGKAASIRADATGSGDGGTVVLWSDGATRAFGSISAAGGKGGRVETSGHYLDVNGIRVKTGVHGTWLLDPYDVTIGANGSTDLLDTVDEFVDTPADTMTLIDSAMLNSAAPATDITIQARHDVLINGAITRPGTTTGKLSVEAGNHIAVDAGITTSGGALTLSANVAPYASGTGTVAINGALSTGGGNLLLSGQNVRIGNTGGAVVNVGDGFMTVTAVDTFQLAANGSVQGGGDIAIVADNVTMPGGMIGPALAQRPTVSISPYTASRDIAIASGAPMNGVLQLSPFDLNPIHSQELTIGGAGYGGKIGVYAALGGQFTPAETRLLRLSTSGNIDLNAPITLLPGTGSKLALERFGAGAGLINTASSATLGADHVLLASDNINIGANITGTGSNGGLVVLSPGNPTTNIHLGNNALDASARLGLNTSELNKIFARQLTIGGELAQTGAVDINGALDLSTSLAPTSKLAIKAGDGAINLLDPIITPGALVLSGKSVSNSATAPARAAAIGIQTRQQAGSASTPFYTQTAFLTANNAIESSTGPINISNTGTLNLGSVTQNGANNMGAIMIANKGGMTVLKDEPVSTSPVIISSLGGPIKLSTESPLTINGSVASNGGAIGLQAGNGGMLTIGTSGSVASGAGNISMVAGAIVNDGSVSATSGNISVSAASLSGTGTIASTSGAVSGVPGKVPTLDACIATPTLAGCSTVLADAVSACSANPTLSYCAAVLPSVDACTANPAMPGCSVVLPTLSQCVATPTAPGCSVVLPSLSACIATPAATGCSVVLPSLKVCIATPTAAGCSVVLPTLAVCTSAPSTPGCSVVLPTLAQCVVNPTQPGCAQVLPSLTTCIAAPATNGCTAVLPTLAACLATPSRAGCVAVLPTLAACVASPTQAGCSVVLPSLAACSASPGLPGCSVVLPSVAQCVAAPTQVGCAAVLPTLAQCISATSLPGCSVVLPSLSRCVANPATPGCAVVLPSLSQCVANPGASGCPVVLPTLAQCATNPAVPGCNVVLPTLNQCVGNAGLPGCGAVLPSLQSCVANPGAPGCSVVLPTLAQCTVTPSLAACNVVLPTVAQCAAAPGLAGCVAVLPPLAQCVATPSAPGCALVLPGLGQCVATPAAAGCSVVLPTLAQCVGSPGLQGCSVVLPPVNSCVDNPALAGCTVVAPPQQLADGVVKEVIVNTINVINSVTPSADSKAPEKTGSKEAGAKIADTSTIKGDASELRKKTYCN